MTTPLNKSVMKSFRILSLFRGHPEGLTLTEMAVASRMSIATVHRFAKTFEAVGALHTNARGRFALGKVLIELSECTPRPKNSYVLLNDYLEKLAESTEQTYHVAVGAGDMVRYIAKSQGALSPAVNTAIGFELEAYCTAVGKILLAHLPRKLLRTYLDAGDFISLTPNTIIDPAQLKMELLQIREQGFAIDDEEFEEGLHCTAVPVRNRRGAVCAALSVSQTSLSARRNDPYRIAAEMRQHAQIIASYIEEGLHTESSNAGSLPHEWRI